MPYLRRSRPLATRVWFWIKSMPSGGTERKAVRNGQQKEEPSLPLTALTSADVGLGGLVEGLAERDGASC